MLPTALAVLLIPLLNLFLGQDSEDHSQTVPRLRFDLRHQHAVAPSGEVVFSDVRREPVSTQGIPEVTHELGTTYISSFRPPSFNEYAEARMRSIRHGQSTDLLWSSEEILAPHVESRETLLELAKMTNNAYVTPNDSAWYTLNEQWAHVRLRARMLPDPSTGGCSGVPDLTRLRAALPVWLGTRRGRIPRPRLRDAGQLDDRAVHQGHVFLWPVRRRRSDYDQGQTER